MISSNTSLSNPMPLPPGGDRAPAPAPAIPEPSEKIESVAIEFSGLGGEYFRIWIVNLLLIMVTFGIYYPWAKVRKLKYFYNNTHIDGHALEFHGEAKKMLGGTMIAWVLFSIYSVASAFSSISGGIAILVLIGLAPVLLRGVMRFRLANTSWRGIRMRFTADDLKEAYLLFLLPLAALIAFGLGLAGLAAVIEILSTGIASRIYDSKGLIGAVAAAIVFPYYFWRLKRYQHNHYAWGPLQTEYRSELRATYLVCGKVVLLSLAIAALFGVAFWSLLPNVGASLGKPGVLRNAFLVLVPLFLLFVVVNNILPRAYFTAHMQNLIWSRTGNNFFRFKSELSAIPFIGLQFKNYFLILLTFGLYWPFAVIATKRMQLEAISLKTRISLDKLTDAARSRENNATGDMAADIFGFDVGM